MKIIDTQYCLKQINKICKTNLDPKSATKLQKLLIQYSSESFKQGYVKGREEGKIHVLPKVD